MKNTKRQVVSGFTYWRVLIAFLALYAGLVLLLFLWRNPSPVFSDAQSTQPQERCRILAQLIEDQVLGVNRQESASLVDQLRVANGRFPDILRQWLDTRPQILSVTLWLRNQDWPIRSVKQDFWNAPGLQSLSAAKRTILFNDLFPTSYRARAEERDVVVEVHPVSDLNLDLIWYHLPLYDEPVLRALEIQSQMPDLNQILAGCIQENEKAVLLDETGQTLAKTGSSTENRIQEKNESILVSESLPNLLWKVNLTTQPEQKKSIPVARFFPFPALILGLISTLVLALVLSGCLDRTLKIVSREATEVARGNFQGVVLPVKHPSLNRIVGLFNYMAKEMGRVQRMDVSEILHEKSKTETIIRNIADGVLVTDAQNRVVLFNSVTEKWFGLRETGAFQRPVAECIKSQPLLSFLQDIRDGRHDHTTEFPITIGEKREKRIFQAHGARLHDREDNLLGAVTVIRDITREKEIDRMKTELISMVAHELKSPLTSIFGFSELLLESDLQDSKAKEYAKVILTESTRLTDLVNKFLDLSRLESGRTEIHMNPFNLGSLVEKIIENYRCQAEKKGIKVIADIPENLPTALGEQDLIEQVLLNLYSNAVKYSPKYSKIGIEIKTTEKELVVSVIDNGYGIPKEALPHIFEKFYRVAPEEGMEEAEGSGLGLALAKEIVERHGGTIKVNSKLGVGSVFSFNLQKGQIE